MCPKGFIINTETQNIYLTGKTKCISDLSHF